MNLYESIKKNIKESIDYDNLDKKNLDNIYKIVKELFPYYTACLNNVKNAISEWYTSLKDKSEEDEKTYQDLIKRCDKFNITVDDVISNLTPERIHNYVNIDNSTGEPFEDEDMQEFFGDDVEMFLYDLPMYDVSEYLERNILYSSLSDEYAKVKPFIKRVDFPKHDRLCDLLASELNKYRSIG